MSALRRLVDFYRAQVDVVWHWRRGRRQLAARAVISFLVAFASLGATAALLPGVKIDTPFSLTLAVITIGALSALVRPILLALVAPFSIVLMLLFSLVFQVAVILALVPLVPGVHVTSFAEGAIAAVVFAVLGSLLSWLLALDSDDSYYSMLVRRLLVKRGDAIHTKRPGLVIIQIDGLAHEVLLDQVSAGRVPVMSRWINRGRMQLTPWIALLPSQTSASQAGILFGNNDGIPGFRWYDKENARLFVSNHADDAQWIEEQLGKRHTGLLAKGGASIGNLLSGGAVRSYLTLSTMSDPTKGLGRSRSYFSFFLSPYGFVHAIVLGTAEVAKEIFQARRARLAGIEPYLARGFPYPILRALTNVVLRPLSTSLVIEEMLRGTPVIYVTYTDYDEIAHHSGPRRAESLDALDGVDRVIGSLVRASEDAPRPYEFVVLSDHGQTLGATFLQRHGKALEVVIRQLMGGVESISATLAADEQWRVANSFVAELTHARGARTVATRALRARAADKPDRRAMAATASAESDKESGTPEAQPSPDLVLCSSGNLALAYFPEIPGRADLETINARYPGLVEALANHPGVGLLMVRSSEHGILVIGPSGVRHLGTRRIEGEDPLAPYGHHAAAALKRLDSLDNCGDLAIVSSYDPNTGQVAAFEELIGSHGGLGGPQTNPFLLYPQEWQLEREQIVGAPQVNGQLSRWLDDLLTAKATSPSLSEAMADQPPANQAVA